MKKTVKTKKQIIRLLIDLNVPFSVSSEWIKIEAGDNKKDATEAAWFSAYHFDCVYLGEGKLVFGKNKGLDLVSEGSYIFQSQQV
jgi:hypothetical protein